MLHCSNSVTLHGQDGTDAVSALRTARCETDRFTSATPHSQHRNGVIGAATADTEAVQERFDFRVRLVVEGRVHRFLTLRVTFNPLEFDFSASHTRNLSSPRPLRARCSIFQRSLNLGAAANREGALKT